MKRNIKIYEMPLLYLTLFLMLFGAIMQYSASSTIAINKFGWNNYNYFFSKHIIRLIIGLIAMLIMFKIEFIWLKKYSKHILFLSWIIIIAAYFFNNGSTTRRFLIISGKNILTTSDFARFALIVFTANFISENRKNLNRIKIIIPKYISYVSFTLLLILIQPDLSSTFIISLILISMLLIGGLKIKYILIVSMLGFTILYSSIMLYDFQKERLENWKNNNHKIHSQVERSKQALYNGGLFGVGFSKSIIKEGFMAEGHTDFILPIIGEEIGFIGITFIFILFFSFYLLSISTAKNAPNIFSSILCIGIAFNILYYFLINSSYVVGLIPPTGIAIPFISYGGSHTLFTLISVGTLLNISKYSNIYKRRYFR